VATVVLRGWNRGELSPDGKVRCRLLTSPVVGPKSQVVELPVKPLIVVGVVAAVVGGLLGTGMTLLLTGSGAVKVAGKQGPAGPPGDPGPPGPRGRQGAPGDSGDLTDVQSPLDDLDSRVSDLEDVGADSRLSDLDDRVSTLETFKDSACTAFGVSDISDLFDASSGC
jgi:hypothetical protein